MCGIAGILNLKEARPVDVELIKPMMAAIRHRGPDESGIYVDPWVGLGHVRLSIIGVEGGGQPICNADRSLWIVYNGEAFNYIELKAELIQKGHQFFTETDTEVVLHLYEAYGPQCLERINGQFALAIWDARKKELLLARDRVGIRPLFYTRFDNRLIFASEIKSILMYPGVPRVFDTKALQQVFTFWTTITPATIFENIMELPPGAFMRVRDGRFTQRTFWNIPHYSPAEQFKGSFEESCEELKEVLTDAVRIRLRSDVPVGAYASGGLDSSITTALISKYFNNRLKTFSIGFEESTFDERVFQNDVVAHLGTHHRRILATNELIRRHFADVVWLCEKPILRTAPVPLFLLSKLVRENHFKVVMTGEGADEIFGGYNIFKEAKIRAFWGRRPESRLRPLLLERLYPYIFKNPSRARAFLQKFYSVTPGDLKDLFFSHRIRWNNTGKNRTFFSDHLIAAFSDVDPYEPLIGDLPTDFETRDVLSRAQYLEMAIFLSNYLLSSQGDRPAMGNSLEIRLPFLDFRVIDFAYRLPAKWKINGLDEKYILKQSFRDLIPERIRRRVKQPYRAPIKEVFFTSSGSDHVNEMLSETYLKKVGLFNEKKTRRLISKFTKSEVHTTSEVQNMAVVGILSTQLVYHQFIENFPWKPMEPLVPDKIIRITN
jgi:asparagine synthase (glutamine-hydrolysing)